jgi:Uma2 family endonuclease
MTVVQPLGEPQLAKLTLDDFELLHRSGAFERQSKVELIGGVLLTMNPQRVRHSYAKTELARRLANALEQMATRLRVLVEATIAMPPDSAPEPDVVLTDAELGDHYVPLASVALVVEISDSSVRYDLGDKAVLYSSQGIREYWVVDVSSAIAHQFWSPSDEGYGGSRAAALGERIESVTIAGLAVETDGLI